MSQTNDPSEATMTFGPDAIERETSGLGGAEAEIAALRKRLAFYEGFEHIIQENIARSGELLHRAAERQAEADRAVALARDELVREIGHNRQTLSKLSVEIANLRDAADGLVNRISSAIATEDRRIPDPSSGSSLPVAEATGTLSGGAPQGRDALGPTESTTTRTPSVSDEAKGASRSANGLAEAVSGELQPGDREHVDGRRLADRVDQSVIVHGVSDVPQARSLVDHLRTREAIETVEPKEFLGGILRLMVVGRELRRDDFGGWGREVEWVEDGPGTLVLRLPAARSL